MDRPAHLLVTELLAVCLIASRGTFKEMSKVLTGCLEIAEKIIYVRNRGRNGPF